MHKNMTRAKEETDTTARHKTMKRAKEDSVKKSTCGSTRPLLLDDGESRMPRTLQSSPDTTRPPSPYRPSGLVGGHPLAGVVGNARGMLCRLGGPRGEAKKASVDINPSSAVAARQPPPLHGRQDAAQKNVGLKTYPQTHLPARAGASSLSHPPPVQAGSKSPNLNPIQLEEPDCVRVVTETTEMPKAHKAGWQGREEEEIVEKKKGQRRSEYHQR